MLDLIKSIYRFFLSRNKNKEEPALIEDACGEVRFSWDSQTGSFKVYVDIYDFNQNDAATLGLLLHHLTQGDLDQYFIEALRCWSEESTESLTHAADVLDAWHLFRLNDEAGAPEDLAVSPSNVFSDKNIP